MIEYENASSAPVRCVESEVAGRRIAAHALPYSGEAGAPPFRFDPLERRVVERRASGRVAVGPAASRIWAAAFGRCPAGPVLVGPGSPVEEIRGAFEAAAEGAALAGRAAYLLDPDPAGFPEEPRSAFVSLFAWIPGGEARDHRLDAALARSVVAGALLPVIPGWTDQPEFLERWFDNLGETGARFAAPVVVPGGGEDRRVLVEARARVDPASADRFFEKVHHCDWAASVNEGLRRFRAEAARRRIATLPPRPVGAGEPPGNSAAAARLEERAAMLDEDEHRSALLHAAARWIDESRRDLAAVVREGNFGKVFPFGALAAEAEAAFRTGGPPP
jgi:hypothetical protein